MLITIVGGIACAFGIIAVIMLWIMAKDYGNARYSVALALVGLAVLLFIVEFASYVYFGEWLNLFKMST